MGLVATRVLLLVVLPKTGLDGDVTDGSELLLLLLVEVVVVGVVVGVVVVGVLPVEGVVVVVCEVCLAASTASRVEFHCRAG